MKNKLSYFLAKVPMFGIGFYLLFKENGKNAYISIILGTLLGIIILYIYSLIKKRINSEYLYKKLGFIYNLLFLLINSFLILIIFLVLSMFVNSFYLLNTPKLMVILPFAILAFFLSTKEKFVLVSLTNLLYYFSITIIIIFSILLIPYCDYKELYPIFNYNTISILKGAIIYASITSIPQILIIDYYSNFKEIYINYIKSSIINLLLIIFTTLPLGSSLVKVYSFPEYDVLRQIKILDFIENIESISTLGWYTELFISLSLLLRNIKNYFPKKKNNIYVLVLMIILIYISSFVIGGDYTITISLFYNIPFILLVFFIIVLTLLIYLKIKKKVILDYFFIL